MNSDLSPTALVIGLDPSTLDPASCGVTPQENAAVLASIEEGERRLREAGYAFAMCLIPLDVDLEAVLVPRVRERHWDVVVIDGVLRNPPERLSLFEAVVNAVHRHAPEAAIAFNTGPTDILEAARRRIALF